MKLFIAFALAWAFSAQAAVIDMRTFDASGLANNTEVSLLVTGFSVTDGWNYVRTGAGGTGNFTVTPNGFDNGIINTFDTIMTFDTGPDFTDFEGYIGSFGATATISFEDFGGAGVVDTLAIPDTGPGLPLAFGPLISWQSPGLVPVNRITISAPTNSVVLANGFDVYTTTVPEPGTYATFAVLFVGLGFYGFKRKKAG